MNSSMPLALLIEDEMELAVSLKLALKKLSFSVIHTPNLDEARNHLNFETLKLVIIDRMLPDGEGLDLCSELRAKGFDGGILILTAKGATSERIEGLKAGADDYLPKPFSWEEFEARVRAVLRRTHSIPKPSSHWELNADSFSVMSPNGWVVLTKLEFQMAALLIQSPGQVVSRDSLLKDVWGYRWLPETRTVDFFLGRLRKKLEKDFQNPKHFLTVRGVGYRFSP